MLVASLNPKPQRGRRRKMVADKAVAYIRVSTAEQELGPEAQRAAIEAYAKSKGLDVTAVFVEVISGAAPLDERHELWAAIDAAKAKRAAVFLVAKRDRLARDIATSILLERDLEAAGIRLESSDGAGNGSGPEAELLRSMLAAIAQFERAMIRSRTKGALSAKAKRGERTGSIPFGQRLASDGVHLESDPAEQEIVGRILVARQRGDSLRQITDDLNASGAPARGAKWHVTSVARVLSRAGA